MKNGKRSKILSAAVKIFAVKGYQYATVSDIAGEAGVSTGLIYSYFENKLDILLSTIHTFWEQFNRLNQEKLKGLDSPFDKLYVLVENFEQLLVKDKNALYQGKVLHEALPHIFMIKNKDLQKKRHEIIIHNSTLVKTIDEIMAEGQEKGLFDRSLKPAVLRQVLFGTMERIIYGLFFQVYSNEERGYDADDVHQALVRMIEKFVRK